MGFRAAILCSACAVHGYACSPEDAEAPFVERDSAVMGIEAGVGSTANTPGARSDAGHLDASATAADGQVDAALDATNVFEASSADAGPAPAESGTPDATLNRDAAADAGGSGLASPSAGCGKGGRPGGGRVSVPGDHNYTFPLDYDGMRPFPLLIGFHAAGNPIDQIENLTKGSELEKSYVRAFPKSKGSAWDYAADIGKVIAMYDDLLANHCVDTNRIFATGHSSGAQLIVQILTPARKADADRLRFKAVAPVAASRYGGVSRAIPILYIHGAHDSVRNNDGSDVVKEFVTANGCMATSTPYMPVAACSSGGKNVEDGCVQYQGCKVPTVWCSHDDPQYSATNHGWPCFASRAMATFFEAVK